MVAFRRGGHSRSNAVSFAAGPMSVALSPGDADQGIIRTESLTKVDKGADFRLLTIERGEWGSWRGWLAGRSNPKAEDNRLAWRNGGAGAGRAHKRRQVRARGA